MQLDLDTLSVETFATASAGPSEFANGAEITYGRECTVTVPGSCTCNCHTPRYDCV